MTKILFFISFFLASSLVLGQSCLPGTTIFSTQDQVDNFHINHPLCDAIEGNIVITGTVAHLDSLIYIKSIEGSLTIKEAPSMTSLHGLDSLHFINGSLLVQQMDNLLNPEGLNHLQQIGDSLQIIQCDTLLSIAQLMRLQNIGKSIIITHNKKLSSLQGLDSLQKLNEDLLIDSNIILNNIVGLQNIDTSFGSIRLLNNHSLASLEGLSNLQSIEHNLELRSNYNLTNLVGFDSLSNLGGQLYLQGSGLTSLQGLSGLTELNDTLSIIGLPYLTSLQGLDSLQNIETILIQSCPLLTNLAPLSGTEFHGTIQLIASSFTDLSIFENLTIVHGGLVFHKLDSLINLNDFSNLQKIEGHLVIKDNDMLSDISGLADLDSVEGFVYIGQDSALTSLSGIDNLFYIGASTLDLVDNPQLTTCGVPSVCYHAQFADFFNVFDNAAGCNSPTEIENSCNGPIIQGSVFFDALENCSYDNGETPLSNWTIIASNGTDTVIDITDSNGFYKLFPSTLGIYTVSTITPPNWTNNCSSSNIELGSNDDIDTLDFFVQPTVLCPNLSVDLAPSYLEPNSNFNYNVQYCNNGTKIATNIKIHIAISDWATIDSASIDYTVNEDTLIFTIPELTIGECHNFNIYGQVNSIDADGQALCANTIITSDEICPTFPNPTWSGAFLAITSNCTETDNLNFTVKNIGIGDMNQPESVDLIIEDWVIMKTDLQLPSGGDTTFSILPEGRTCIMRAQQVANHPDRSHPLVAIEGCGVNNEGSFTTGQILQYPEDDEDDFISIACEPVYNTGQVDWHMNFPTGYSDEHHYIPVNRPIEYKINFQNKHKKGINNVVIKEVLSPYLDKSSLQLGASSHAYSFSNIGDTLVFHFSNIQLANADSFNLASKGFVKFKLNQKLDLPLGTIITNQALLYYGTDSVSIANEVFNTVEEDFVPLSIFSPKHQSLQISAAPNPFQNRTILNVEGVHFKSAQIMLYDELGRLVRTEKFSDQFFTLERKDLIAGIYSFQIIFDNNTFANGRITVF